MLLNSHARARNTAVYSRWCLALGLRATDRWAPSPDAGGSGMGLRGTHAFVAEDG